MPPLTYISAFTRTDATGGSRGETMLEREKIMAETFAFGEFWRRLSHLGKFNTCQWHSACTKFGHYKDLITLSCARSACKDAESWGHRP